MTIAPLGWLYQSFHQSGWATSTQVNAVLPTPGVDPLLIYRYPGCVAPRVRQTYALLTTPFACCERKRRATPTVLNWHIDSIVTIVQRPSPESSAKACAVVKRGFRPEPWRSDPQPFVHPLPRTPDFGTARQIWQTRITPCELALRETSKPSA